MSDRLAPNPAAIFGVGLHAKLIDRVWLQIINDRVTGVARLIVPLPVPLTITNHIVPEPKQSKTKEVYPESNGDSFTEITRCETYLDLSCLIHFEFHSD